jgi:hypothetical protein
MFNKYHATALLVLLFIQPCHADEVQAPLDITGANGSLLQFKNWHQHGGWTDIEYKGPGGAFRIYDLPSTLAPSGIGRVVSSDAESVSPGKKFILVYRTDFGDVIDEQGNAVNSEQTHCEAVSLENGCVKDVGSVYQCEGTWVGDKWKDVRGEVFDFSKGGMSPNYLVKEVSGSSSNEFRANSLMDLIFMGVPSYMACYPPEKNISEYNDIGFYFAQGGQHLLAMQIYNRLLSLAPDRVPLKLNVADSLWALGKRDEAKTFYTAYRDAMLKKGAVSKLPKRVDERLN